MKMKKVFILTIFVFILSLAYLQRNNILTVVRAVDVTEDNSYLGLVDKGWNISCLSASPAAGYDTNHVPADHALKIDLKGTCEASSPGCYLVVCQGPNEQYYEDLERMERCQEHDPSEPREGGNYSTWGEWCAHVEEQMGDTFESTQGCKSGVTELDAVLPNSSDPTIPTAIVGNPAGQYHFAPGPIVTTITLNNAYDHIPYQFYAFGQGVANGLGSGSVEGDDKTQQLGQINTFTPGAEGNVSKCVTITWDPYGRVFDSQSLEPITDVQVNLLDQLKKPAKQITKNYDITSTNGVFNIQVENQGNYYMSVDSPFTHDFITNPKLNPNYRYIYSDIYYPNQMFFEKTGVPTHHDIPLNPKGAPYHSDIVIYEQSLNQMDMGDRVKFEGKVSHPLANICLQGETTKKNYVCSQSDKIGQFQIFISKKNYPQEALIIKATKIDPNNISQFIQQSVKVESSVEKKLSKEVKFEPLLRYFDGYVYDQQGQIAPNAQVNIRLKQDKKLIYKTVSDDKGYIKITPKNLPLFDYYLEVIPSQSPAIIKLTTSQFIKVNQDYLDSEKLNLMTGVAGAQSVTNPSSPDRPTTNGNNNSQIPDKKESTSPFNKNLLIVGLILFLLISVTAGLVLYIKKSK